MTYRQIAIEIHGLQRQLGQLQDEHAAWVAAKQEALARDARWFNEADIRDCESSLAIIERQMGTIEDRIAAFEARLPTLEARQDAERKADNLLAETRNASAHFAEVWCRFVAALEAAEHVGHELIQARQVARPSIFALDELRHGFGLAIEVPRLPTPAREEEELAVVLAVWLRDTAHGEPGDTVVRDLNALRAKLAS